MLAYCLHPQIEHQIYLSEQQWVVGMDADAHWLEALGPDWSMDRLRIPLHGNSMWPVLATPTELHIAPPSNIRPGTVVLWGSKTHAPHARRSPWVAHRVVSITASTGVLITRGDNNFHMDPPLSWSQLLGVVIGAGAHQRDPSSWTAQCHARYRRRQLQLRHYLQRCSTPAPH